MLVFHARDKWICHKTHQVIKPKWSARVSKIKTDEIESQQKKFQPRSQTKGVVKQMTYTLCIKLAFVYVAGYLNNP